MDVVKGIISKDVNKQFVLEHFAGDKTKLNEFIHLTFDRFISFDVSVFNNTPKSFPQELKCLKIMSDMKSIIRCFFIINQSDYIVQFTEKLVKLLEKLFLLVNDKSASVNFIACSIISWVVKCIQNELFLNNSIPDITHEHFSFLLQNKLHGAFGLLSIILSNEDDLDNNSFVFDLIVLSLKTLNNYNFDQILQNIIILKVCTKLSSMPFVTKIITNQCPKCFTNNCNQIIREPVTFELYLQFLMALLPNITNLVYQKYDITAIKPICNHVFQVIYSEEVIDEFKKNPGIIETKLSIKQHFILLLYYCNLILGCHDNSTGITFFKELVHGTSDNIIGDIIDLFLEEDDLLVKLLLLNLILFTKESKMYPCIVCFNPHVMFNCFLAKVGFDSSLLIDWLVSSETEFLCFLLQYVKFTNSDWHNLPQNSCIHSILPVIFSIKSSLEKLGKANAIPFNPALLLKHICSLQQLHSLFT